MEKKRIEHNFDYHKPSPDKINRHETVRQACKQLAYGIDELCPDGREKALAFTKIEEAMMWANAAIARND